MHAYTPGLRVSEEALVRKRRSLPVPGKVLKKKGDRVLSTDVVARTLLSGKARMVNAASLLGIPPEDLSGAMKKKEGERVKEGEVMAETKGLFGFFRSRVLAPVDGTIEGISRVTGQVTLREMPLPLEVLAYVDGVVEEVMEEEGVVVMTRGVFIQGIFGLGGESGGVLEMAIPEDGILDAEVVSPEWRGKVIFGGSLITLAALRRCMEEGVKGVVVGGMAYGDVKRLLGQELGVATTGREKIGITIVVTEGFGRIPMAGRTFQILSKNRGRRTSINGATQIRAGVLRPEVIVPRETSLEVKEKREEKGIEVGSTVRVIRSPHFGRMGKVTSLPAEPASIPTEAKVRVLEVAFMDGGKAILPRANVEMIEL